MPYKHRASKTNTCPHCHSEYESRHLRRRFCSDSCRVLAAMARKKGIGKFTISKAAKPIATDIATAAAGSLLAHTAIQIGKHFTNYQSPELQGINELRAEVAKLRALLAKDAGNADTEISSRATLIPVFTETGRKNRVALPIGIAIPNSKPEIIAITEYTNGQKSHWQGFYKDEVINFTSTDGSDFTFLSRYTKQQSMAAASK